LDVPNSRDRHQRHRGKPSPRSLRRPALGPTACFDLLSLKNEPGKLPLGEARAAVLRTTPTRWSNATARVHLGCRRCYGIASRRGREATNLVRLKGRPHRHLLHVDDSRGEAGDQRRRSYRDGSPAARSRRARRQPRARPAIFPMSFVERSLTHWYCLTARP